MNRWTEANQEQNPMNGSKSQQSGKSKYKSPRIKRLDFLVKQLLPFHEGSALSTRHSPNRTSTHHTKTHWLHKANTNHSKQSTPHDHTPLSTRETHKNTNSSSTPYAHAMSTVKPLWGTKMQVLKDHYQTTLTNQSSEVKLLSISVNRTVTNRLRSHLIHAPVTQQP